MYVLSDFVWLLLHLLNCFNTLSDWLCSLLIWDCFLSTEMQFITFFNGILNLFSNRFLILSKPMHYEATTVLAIWLTWFSVTLPQIFIESTWLGKYHTNKNVIPLSGFPFLSWGDSDCHTPSSLYGELWLFPLRNLLFLLLSIFKSIIRSCFSSSEWWVHCSLDICSSLACRRICRSIVFWSVPERMALQYKASFHTSTLLK